MNVLFKVYKPRGRSRLNDHSHTITLAFSLVGFYTASTAKLNSPSISPKPTVLLFTYYRSQRLWALKVCSSVVLQASSSVGLDNVCWY